MCSVSGHVFFLDLEKINKLDSACIWNQRLFIQIYTCTWRVKGTLQLIETRLLFGNLRKPSQVSYLTNYNFAILYKIMFVCFVSLLWQ